jgi:hypothetical protein
MEKKKFLLGMLAVALVFGMTVVGCGGDDDDTDDLTGKTGGTFTLTNISATYNGKYAYFQANLSNGDFIYGFNSANSATSTITLVQISNEQVTLPMWASISSRYSGNGTVTSNESIGQIVMVGIFNTPTITSSDIANSIQAAYAFQSITFSNGNATKSANDGNLITEF